MNVEINFDNVIDYEYNIEEDGIYTITFAFDDGQVCSLGYNDVKRYLKDCTMYSERMIKC